jgi:hypothetical protein
MKPSLTRRDFLRGTSLAVLGTAVGFPRNPWDPQPTPPQTQADSLSPKSRVILIRHAEALDENSEFNGPVIQQMLDEAVMKLLDQGDPAAAFRLLVKPDDIVGIKSNVWSYLPTPPEVEQAIKRRVFDAGVKEENIAIDDHGVKENPIFVKSTALINTRPLRTHYLAGMSGCIKNYIMFGQSQEAYHPDSCAALGSLFDLPQVKGKTRLNVLVALTPQFHGRGPHHFSRRYVWNYKGLIVGQDPVAVDTVALRLIMAKRRLELGPGQELPPVPKHIQIADTKYGVGTSDIDRIELIKLGWAEDILI